MTGMVEEHLAALLLAALSAGLLGSPHCMGMCGGIVTAFALSMPSATATQKLKLTLLYHSGRLISYALLGLLAGGLGMAVLAPLHGTVWPRVLLAAALLLTGLLLLGLPLLGSLERVGARLWQRMAPVRQRLFPLHTAPRALAAGLLWGFLPCGLVYGALLTAAASGAALSGAAVMVVFGLGTLPLLLLSGTAGQALGPQVRRLRPVFGALLLVAGVWTLWMPVVGHSRHGAHAHGHQPASSTPVLPTSAHFVDAPDTTTHHETHPTR